MKVLMILLVLYCPCCDTLIPFTYYSLPYAGKLEKVEGPVANHYITGTNEYSKYLINKLSAYRNPQGINISIDCYFTSFSLATWVLEKNTTDVSTMKHNPKGISKELKPVANEGKICHACL